MKYQVQIKYTNPSHEHVSLRRRVESVTRLVEAANEEQAILRASKQQKALGFLIKEANVIKEKKHDKENNEKTVVAKGKEIMQKAEGKDEEDEEKDEEIEEGFDPDPSDIAAHLVKKHGKGKVTKDHVDSYERDRDSNTAIDKEAVMKHVKKMSEEVEQVDEVKAVKAYDKEGKLVGRYRSMDHAKQMKPGHTYKVEEEVELDEANMRFDYEAAARPKSADVKNFLNRDKNARAAAASKKYIRRMTKLGGLGPNQTKKDTEAHMKAHFEEVEYIEEKLTAADPASKWISDFVASDNPKFAGKSKKERIQMALGAHYAAKRAAKNEEVEVNEASKEAKDVMFGLRSSMKSMDLRHGVDSDKRVSGYKMSPAVKAAQTKSDALSKVVKRPQAGTLAAKKLKEATEKMVKKVKAIKNDKRALKKAQMNQNVEKKKVNKINMEPSVEVKG